MSLQEQLKNKVPKKSIIRKAKHLVDKAVEQIRKYQRGEDTPIKTRFTHFNNNSLGGIFKGMIITIAGVSGSGKTYVLQQIENDIFNPKLNPDCGDYVLLRCNWEMTVFKLLLRKLKNTLHKTMKSILFNVPEGEERESFKQVCDTERSDNVYYLEEPCDPTTWYENVKEFILEHKAKKQIVVSIDHIALVRDLLGSKKKAMDELVENINSLKKEFTNVSFLIVSQMNRDIEGRVDVRHLAPKRSDLYNTDTLFQISDIVLVIHNPYKIGHEKYMVVAPSRYPYLIPHMDKPNNKRTNFLTRNLIFWHYLKIREIEDMENIEDIHVESLSVPSLKGTLDEAQATEGVEEDITPVQIIKRQVERHEELPDDFLNDNEDDGVPF